MHEQEDEAAEKEMAAPFETRTRPLDLMTEAECYYVEKLFRKYGHGPVLDLITAVIEPHPAEDESHYRRERRQLANELRRFVANAPKINY